MSKYYAVVKGYQPGIFRSWEECRKSVHGFKGNKYESFKTLEEAEDYINNSTQDRKKLKVTNCLYVDGAHNKFTGSVALSSVVDENYCDKIEEFRYLFNDIELVTFNLPVGIRTLGVANFDDVKSQQNNGAELLALIMGLRIAIFTNSYSTIFSDSQLMVDFWSRGYFNGNPKMDPIKKLYIEELIGLRKKFNGEIIKIPGKLNKADLGFHKKKK